MRKDLASAYLAALTKIGSWAAVSAIVYRWLSPKDFAILALARATIGFLNYTSVGLAPAMIHRMAEAARRAQQPVSAVSRPAYPALDYESKQPDAVAPDKAPNPVWEPYSNGLVVAAIAAVVGLIATFVYAPHFVELHRIQVNPGPLLSPRSTGRMQVEFLVVMMGIGTTLRLASDACGAVLQASGRIFDDNVLLMIADIVWVVASISQWRDGLEGIGFTFAASSLLLLFLRYLLAQRTSGLVEPVWKLVSAREVGALLSFGILVTAAQLADYLYAPTDYILISRLLDQLALAAYAPAVQIDAGLLLLVSGLAAVLLPRTAIAHAADDRRTIRRYYVRGTLASTTMLLVAAAVVWLTAPVLLRIWLGSPLPMTLTILPMVLIHTVVGGSSAVGRSILLAVGKVKPFTAAVLTAGICNVILSYSFVRFFGMGLKGIVLGTIVAVVGRCAIWMPWYVLRTLKRAELSSAAEPVTLTAD